MDEAETKTCQNCKREIPAVNFTTHSVHCARNIRVCPVCKEPTPLAELDAHHEKLHRLLPCKQCGEKICGTDMEDHIRDSCAHTIKTCRFCELEVSRRELPHHEGYCGARTEQCADCKEWVMMKYRQLHLDSNHGFLRLDDDPVPTSRTGGATFTHFPKLGDWPKPAQPATGFNRPLPSSSGVGAERPSINGQSTNFSQMRPRTEIRYFNNTGALGTPAPAGSAAGDGAGNPIANVLRPLNNLNLKPLPKRNNQPQAFTTAQDDVNKSISRGAVKKRLAPKPPVSASSPATSSTAPARAATSTASASAKPGRSSPVSSPDDSPTNTLERKLTLEDHRKAHNSSPAACQPYSVKPAEKLEKLWQTEFQHSRRSPEVRDDLQGWPAPGYAHRSQRIEMDRRRNDLKNLKPMTAEQFANRFKELRLVKEPAGAAERREVPESGDRFSEIKSSLKQLRRGLNEVIAPYNMNTNNNNINAEERADNWRPGGRGGAEGAGGGGDGEGEGEGEEEGAVAAAGAGGVGDGLQGVRLPCEFCGAPVPAGELVLHQTGCRPDLARFAGGGRSPPLDNARAEPVIPCEFCAESLPLYLISEHQERCGREANLLFPD